MIHHVTRATRHLIFWSLIATAIGLTSVRLILTGIENYKSDIAAQVSELLGAPVKIGRIRAKMRGFSPELIVSEIAIASEAQKEKPAIRLREIRLGLNLLDAIMSRDLLSSSWVTLVGVKLSVKRLQDGSFAIVGLKSTEGQPLWLLQGRKYEVLQSEVTWQDEKNKGRPLQFSSVDAAIINDDQRHRINILMKLPKKYGDLLRLSMDLEGNIFEPSAIHGVVFVEGKQLNPVELINHPLPLDIKITSGAGDFQIWSDWKQSRPVSVRGHVQLHPLKLLRQDYGALAVNKLEGSFNWTLSDKLNSVSSPWQLDVNHFLIETAAITSRATTKSCSGAFNMKVLPGSEPLQPKLGISFDQLDLQEAASIFQFFAPLKDEQAKLIKQAQLRGALENFSLFTDLADKSFAANGHFTQIGFSPVFSVPGFENLDGHLKGTDKQGMVELSTQNARLNSATLFREVLNLKTLTGTLSWQQNQDSWTVSGHSIDLDSVDIQTQSKFQLNIPKNEDKAFLDMQMAFTGNDVSKVRHYLPSGIMGANTIAWLDRAFISGQVTQGGMLFRGKPHDFPFIHGEGVFETLFDVDKLELSYHPDWPNLTGVNAEVLFDKESLQVNLNEGFSNKLKINPTEVSIPNLNNSKHLLVKGSLESGIGDVLGFLQQTPLKAKIDPVMDAITPEGDTRVVLDLKIPLVEGVPPKVDGSAELNEAKLLVKSVNLPVTRMKGLLKFNEEGVYSDDIAGAALGYSIQIKLINAPTETTIKVKGRTSINNLKEHFKMPGWDSAKGLTDYFVQLDLPYSEPQGDDGKRTAELKVESDLIGVVLDLPGLLAKTKEQKNPLSLTFSLADEQKFLPLKINYDNKLKAVLQINSQARSIYSGHVLLGDGEPEQRKEPGLKIEINRDPLVLQDWLGLAVQTHEAEALSTIREIKIHSDHALWSKTALGAFDLVLKQEKNQWLGTIGSVFASGNIQFPIHATDSNKIDLVMDRLDISALKQLKFQNSGEGPDILPASLPLFNLVSQKTLWKSINLGQLSLQSERVKDGIGFKKIELTGSDATLQLSGEWTAPGNKSSTHATGHLEMPKAGDFLAQLGATKDLAETNAGVDFSLAWNAAPYQVSLAALKGQLDVSLKNGRILSIEPGFGRVLGVLAMAQWLKRLQLDFSDIYEEGLTFNTIKGRFDLQDGKAITNNLVVDAVPAKITITGNTDLVGRTVDHIVNVAPKSADALPIAGTIMGKVAKLLARSLTGEDHEGFLFGSQYLVKGAWGEAQIIPLHENDGLLQKTWNGITAFPWLEQNKNQ